MVTKDANDKVAEFVRSNPGRGQDRSWLSSLSPRPPLGTKRICIDTNYYETFNRDNVTLVDIRKAPIEEITRTGLRTKDADIELDSIIFATGFDAMTGALLAIDIRGRGGASLRDKWAGGPRTYLGLTVAGLPNLFTITGPGSPSVLSNMIISIEQHVDWIADCVSHMGERELATIEANPEAEDVGRSRERRGGLTLYPRQLVVRRRRIRASRACSCPTSVA
jgi:cation diffusion facilitator CzcD-associated flavoprotein CzcO